MHNKFYSSHWFLKNQICSLFPTVKMNANYAEICRVGYLEAEFLQVPLDQLFWKDSRVITVVLISFSSAPRSVFFLEWPSSKVLNCCSGADVINQTFTAWSNKLVFNEKVLIFFLFFVQSRYLKLKSYLPHILPLPFCSRKVSLTKPKLSP